MKRDKFFIITLLATAGIAAVWSACNSPVAPGGVLLTGAWGSVDGRLTATQVNTTFVGSCGSGNTTQPIMLDKYGHFDMVGTYGAAGTAQQMARFRGTVSPKKLELRVMMADSSAAVGPMMLDLGQQPALATCR